MTLFERLSRGEFEFSLSPAQLIYYSLERWFGHTFLLKPPPSLAGPTLLNLGCGPHIYQGWVNADDYGFKRRLRERRFRPNWMLDITRTWRCAGDYWDGIFTEHVLEHLSYSEVTHVLQECLRTLKPKAWIRISLPDLGIYASYYEKVAVPEGFGTFPQRALALSFLTQMHLHRSVWDKELLAALLREIGFADVAIVTFGQGTDASLIRDDPDKFPESLYVEARKP